MKVSKLTNCFSGFILLFCLFGGLTLASSQSAMAEAEKAIGSVEDNGIKLTINNYTIQNHSEELMVYYTVESKSGDLIENGTSLIKEPDISIGDKLVKGNNIWHKKISNGKYQGVVKVELSQYRPAISNVAFNTEAILNQKGEWTINFQIEK
jgi:hypothetical protein